MSRNAFIKTSKTGACVFTYNIDVIGGGAEMLRRNRWRKTFAVYILYDTRSLGVREFFKFAIIHINILPGCSILG